MFSHTRRATVVLNPSCRIVRGERKNQYQARVPASATAATAAAGIATVTISTVTGKMKNTGIQYWIG